MSCTHASSRHCRNSLPSTRVDAEHPPALSSLREQPFEEAGYRRASPSLCGRAVRSDH